MIEAMDKLESLSHECKIPYSTRRIITQELSLDDYLNEIKTFGDKKYREEANIDVIKEHYDYIKSSDAILVINIDKNGIKNYIGGNVLMEIGFAYYLDKKIFFYNDIPDMQYTDELKAVKPIVINGDLNKIL